MKPFLILLSLLLTFTFNQFVNRRKQIKNLENETQIGIEVNFLGPKSNKQAQNKKNMRSRNIEIIESNLKSIQDLGEIKKSPLILINKTAFTHQEFKNAKDTITILAKGKINQISVASPMVEKMIRDKYNKSGDTGVLMIQITPIEE